MEYEVIYSKRRSVSLSVKNGKIIVRAPLRFPEERIREIVAKHTSWLTKHLEKDKERRALIEKITPEKEKELRREAKLYLTEKTEQFSRIMGLKYGRITITGAKGRFGSCSSKGNISYSYLLMLCSETAREYVVVHELAHLVEMNHSQRFYKIIEKYMPDYKERKKQLLTYKSCNP